MSSQAKRVLSVVTPVLDTNIYASGDRLGAIMEIKNAIPRQGLNSKLLSLAVLDKAALGIAIDLLFFHSLPAVASADNAAISITDAEMTKCIGAVTIATGDYKVILISGNHLATVRALELVLSNLEPDTSVNAKTSVWCVAVTRGGTPTYAADSLQFTFGVEHD